MNIIIVAQYLRNIESILNNNSRFIYIANLLSKKGHKVEIITSNFLHGAKRHISFVDQPENFHITAIEEPGYPKNVSLKRFSSHKKLSKNIFKYLKTKSNIDCIYCAIPSLDVAECVSRFCRKRNIKFIVDIQDLWPEGFKMLLNFPVLSDILFLPMAIEANRIYKRANSIVAVSQTYLNRALKCNKYAQSFYAFLGTELNDFDSFARMEGTKLIKDNFNIGYCGSLSASYDLKCVIDAMKTLKDQGYKNLHLVVMGEGSRKFEFEKYAKESGISIEFTGMLPYNEMVNLLKQCNIAVNPIKKGSAGSIINKVGDYAMAGLPVVNTQMCDEYQKLLLKYNAGINCDSDNNNTIVEAIKKLIDSPSERNLMSKNSRKLGEELFDRKKTYPKIVELIERTVLK